MHSHTYAALANDDEYADMVVKARKQAEKAGQAIAGGPSLTTWSPEVDMLARVLDKLAVLVEAQKQKPGKVVPYARPSTAFERAQRRDRQATHDRLVAAMLPNRAG